MSRGENNKQTNKQKKTLPNEKEPSPMRVSGLTEDATLELAPALCSFSAL